MADSIKISLTVGKLDAGLAVLLTEDFRLIEFPSMLLPTGVAAGSIVDIAVSRNGTSEKEEHATFRDLQSKILDLYGKDEPKRPILREKNATQTSIVLTWEPISTGSSELRSLSIYKNNSKLGVIPNPQTNTSTKLSGLAIDTNYSFHLVLRTSAGTFTSERVNVRTQKMTELSGITICAGEMTEAERERLEGSVSRIGAKPIQDKVAIDTTHFVCSTGQGDLWKKASEMNIPVVRPDWIEACEREGRIVGVRAYYLNADPVRPKPHKIQSSSSNRSHTAPEEAISPKSHTSSHREEVKGEKGDETNKDDNHAATNSTEPSNPLTTTSEETPPTSEPNESNSVLEKAERPESEQPKPVDPAGEAHLPQFRPDTVADTESAARLKVEDEEPKGDGDGSFQEVVL